MNANARRARRDLLVLSIVLWIITPVAFLSIPLVGIVSALTATFATVGYALARTHGHFRDIY